MYLSNHHVLSSRDIDELRYQLGKQFTPHELNVTKRNHEINSHVSACAVNRIGLSSFAYGEDVPIAAAVNEHQCSEVISLNFLISGSGQLGQNRELVDITVDQGVVIDMERPFGLNLLGYSGIALIVTHETLRQHARTLFGDQAEEIDFQLQKRVDLTKPAGRALKNAVIYAMNEMDGALGELNNPISITNLENYLLTQFITLHPNTFQRVAESDASLVVMPRSLKRARDYIHAHAYEKITLQELANYANCSYRSLQAVFGNVLGMSPMEYLKNVRLEGLRNDLLHANSQQQTVAEIANQWGFMHMGRLAYMYKRQFGVLPSDTLNQKK